MTAYNRNVLKWVSLLVLAFVFGLLGFKSNWFLLPFALVVYLAYLLMNQNRCPNCGMPFTPEDEKSQEQPSADGDLSSTNSHKTCPSCGYKIK